MINVKYNKFKKRHKPKLRSKDPFYVINDIVFDVCAAEIQIYFEKPVAFPPT